MIDIKITGIATAIRRLEALKKRIPDRAKELAERLMREGYNVARVMFDGAIYDGTNDVEVDEPVWVDDVLVLRANGDAVAFIEFGTGTIATPYPALPVGGDPYTTLGMDKRGEYGKGHGKNPPWFYPLEKGGVAKRLKSGVYSDKWAMTVGNPPARAMYQATVTVSDREKILEIAKEVFRK